MVANPSQRDKVEEIFARGTSHWVYNQRGLAEQIYAASKQEGSRLDAIEYIEKALDFTWASGWMVRDME